MPSVAKERHREQAIVLLAREISLQSPPNEKALRAAAGIVDAIAQHTIDVYRALIQAEVQLEAEAAAAKR